MTFTRSHTDSSIIEYNEDGSHTETTVITRFPATRTQKVQAWGVLGAIAVLPFVPLAALVVTEKWEERKEARAAKKAAKSEKTD